MSEPLDGLDLSCRCLGLDGRTECEDEATGEDGLCDGCRKGYTPGPLFSMQAKREGESCDELGARLGRREWTPAIYSDLAAYEAWHAGMGLVYERCGDASWRDRDARVAS